MTTPPCICYETGRTNINAILSRATLRLFGPDWGEFEKIFGTFQCYLPPDIFNLIRTNINNILSESGTVTSQVNLLYIITIFVTLLLLVIFIYLTIYYHDNTATLIFAILSIVVIVIAALVLYFGLSTIYNNSINLVTAQFTHIENILQNAYDKAVCCSGLCAECYNVVLRECPET